MKMTDTERWNTAVLIAIDNLDEPHSETREEAAFSQVTVEFYEVRQLLIEHAHKLLAFDLNEKI